MRTRYIIIIGISIPLILFGIFVSLIAINVSQNLENSERWMVELEPHLILTDDQLEYQMQDEDIKELRLYRVQTLEEYFDSLTPNFERQLDEAFDTEYRYVFYIDKHSGYSQEQIKEILTDIEGIAQARNLHDWIFGRD
jgi:hypothetical protein